jgi:hypothetical protein
MRLVAIEDEKSLKKMGLKKPILVVIKGNEFIKVASFNNVEMLNLFIEAIKDYGIIVGEAVEDEVEVDEKSFFE